MFSPIPNAKLQTPNSRVWILVLAVSLSACVPTTPEATATPAPPTATPIPLAARVDGDPIPLAEFEAEVVRFERAQTSLGIDLATLGDYRAQILQSLIDQVLLAQGARAAGMLVSAADIDARMAELASEAGGVEALGAWLAENGYTAPGFQAAVEMEMTAQNMVEHIANSVGDSAEQAHARHIVVSTRAQADLLREEILAGEEFALLARQFTLDLTSRPAGGDLGWFPRGVLLVPEVEEAAFALPPGELSAVIESAYGFHLVETIERGPHPLSPASLVRVRELAVEDWLAAQRESATIEILVAP